MNMNKKLVKIFGISIAVICLLLIGAGFFIVTNIDQNTIKSKAIEYVDKKTGRELKIDGDVNWSFFPWLGVKMQDVSLSNTAGFKGDVFAKAKSVGVSVKLLPLVVGSVEVGNLILDELDLRLIKNRSGIGNWQDLLNSSAKPSGSDKSEVADRHFKKFIIGSVVVNNGRASLQNQQTNKTIKVGRFNLLCKNINFEKPFDIESSFYIDNPGSSLNGKISAKARVGVEIDKGLYVFDDLQLTGELKNLQTGKPFDFKGGASVKLDLEKQTFVAKNFEASIASLTASGSLRGTKIIDAPSLSGGLVVNDSDPKNTLGIFGVYKYPKSLTKASLKVDLTASSFGTKLQIINAKLGDMILKGNLESSKSALNFDLALNKFNFDELVVGGSAPTPSKNKTKSVPVKAQNTHKPKSVSHSQFGFLNNLKLAGIIKIGNMKVNKLTLSNFTANVSGDNGLINWRKIGFDFYNGKGRGNASCNLSGSRPKFNVDMTLGNVLMQPLLKDFANYEKFKGILALNTTLAMSGMSGDQMLASLNGSGRATIANGSYIGVDLPYEVRKAHATLNNKPKPQKTDPPHTDFDSLSMSFRIGGGMLSTNDLLIQAPDYRVTGEGTANIIAKELSLLLSAYSNNDKNFFVPVKITGSFTDPSIRLDAAVMLQHKVKEVITDAIQDQIGKRIENLPENIKNILPF